MSKSDFVAVVPLRGCSCLRNFPQQLTFGNCIVGSEEERPDRNHVEEEKRTRGLQLPRRLVNDREGRVKLGKEKRNASIEKGRVDALLPNALLVSGRLENAVITMVSDEAQSNLNLHCHVSWH